MCASRRRQNSKPEDTLLPGEFEVCVFLLSGFSSPVIAERMSVALNTVKYQIHRAMVKTGKESRTALALWMRERYPTEADLREGYRDACVYCARKRKETNRMIGRSQRKGEA